MSVTTGPRWTRPPRPSWPLFFVLSPMAPLPLAPRTARMHLQGTLTGRGLPELIDDGWLRQRPPPGPAVRAVL